VVRRSVDGSDGWCGLSCQQETREQPSNGQGRCRAESIGSVEESECSVLRQSYPLSCYSVGS